LIVEEIRAELSLNIESSIMKYTKMRRVKNSKSMHCSAVSSKVNAEIVDGSVISHFSIEIIQTTIVEVTVTRPEEINVLFVVNRDMSDRTALN
jgi:hypothetical protein